MPVTALLVTMNIVPFNNACPPAGGVFNVTIKVAAIADINGGSYDAYIYGKNIPDTVLEKKPANGVLPNMANRVQRFVHNFTLKCDNNCEIAGVAATSENNPCDVYAYVAVPLNPQINSTSRTLTLTCTSATDEQRPPQRKQETTEGRKKGK